MRKVLVNKPTGKPTKHLRLAQYRCMFSINPEGAMHIVRIKKALRALRKGI